MSASIPLAVPRTRTRDELFAINERVQTFFLAGLRSKAGQKARAHLADERMLPDWFIAESGLGYIRPGGTRIRDFAIKAGLSLEACVEAGLLNRSAQRAHRSFTEAHGRAPHSDAEFVEFFLARCAEQPDYYYDFPGFKMAMPDDAPEDARPPRRYGDCLTIPIRVHDDAGRLRIAGFQYRCMRPATEIGKAGRYMSPINTPVMAWSETLIGLAEEQETIAASGWVVICEGAFDMYAIRVAVRDLPLGQRPGVVALGGVAARAQGKETDPPEARAGVLGRLTAHRATLFTDDDERGTAAILKVGPVLARLGIHVSVARIADVWDSAAERPKDPGELLQKGGPTAIREALRRARARGLATYATSKVEARLDALSRGGQLWQRLQALDELLPVLEVLPKEVQDRATERVAMSVHFDPALVRLALAERVAGPDPAPARRSEGRPRGRR